MPAKKKQVFITPFSSQKTIDMEKDPNQTKTLAGTFLFPVSSSRVDKIQHVTPMTKNKIKQGLSKTIAACPQGADPKSPSWTFLAVSQASSVGDQTQEKNQTREQCRETEDNPLTQFEYELSGDEASDEVDVVKNYDDVYNYVATPADNVVTTQTSVNKPKTIRRNKKLLAESVKQEVLKTIFKMHQEIMEIQERRNKLELEIAGVEKRPFKKQRTDTTSLKQLTNIVENEKKPREASTEE